MSYIRTIHTDFTRATVAPSYNYPPGLSSASAARRRQRSSAISYRPPPTTYKTSYMKFDPFSDDLDHDLNYFSTPSPPPPPPPSQTVYYRTTPASLVHHQRISSPAYVPSQPQPQPRVHVPVLSSPTPPVLRRTSTSTSTSTPSLNPSIDPNARSRLVAGILLNRVHAVGKPMRRRSFEGPREYVKSSLSSVVSVEA